MTLEAITNHFKDKRAAIVKEQDAANDDLQKAKVGKDWFVLVEAHEKLASAAGKLSLIDQLKTEIVEIVTSTQK